MSASEEHDSEKDIGQGHEKTVPDSAKHKHQINC